MSINLQIWSQNPFDLKQNLIDYDKYQKFEDEWSYVGDGWQVLIFLGVSDQTPHSVRNKMCSARYIAYASIEPIDKGFVGYSFFEDAIRELTRRSNGVWVDSCGEAFGPDEGVFE